jgi:hypothetical protein
MSSEFYDLYKSYDQQELFEILLNPDGYQPEAIECAKQILREKRWSADYQKALEIKKAEQDKADKVEQEDILEKADYYKRAVEIKMQHNAYSVLLGDTSKFEAKLSELNIEYFTDSQSDILQPLTTDYQTYYFKNEDIATVDSIYKELNISSAVFNVEKKAFDFEVRLLFFIVIAVLLIYGAVRWLSSQ